MATTVANLRSVSNSSCCVPITLVLSFKLLAFDLQALMDAQATASISNEEIQSLRLANAKLEAEAAAGPKKSKSNKKLASSPVLEEYAGDLHKFMNQFMLMDFPWVEPKAFLQPPPLVPTLPADKQYQNAAATLLHM